MSNKIPSRAVRNLRNINDYERFYHTKSYLRSLTMQEHGSSDISAQDITVINGMMRAGGYNNLTRFLEHKKDWDSLRRKIPLSYLRHIGYEKKVLQFTLDLDYREYETALRLPLQPRVVLVKLIDSVFIKEPLPGLPNEEKAIEYLRYYAGETRHYCCINYPDLKTVFIEPGGRVLTAYYPPEIIFTKHYAIPRSDGKDIGEAPAS